MISIVKNNDEAKLDYEVFTPPPYFPRCYTSLIESRFFLIKEQKRDTYILTHKHRMADHSHGISYIGMDSQFLV